MTPCSVRGLSPCHLPLGGPPDVRRAPLCAMDRWFHPTVDGEPSVDVNVLPGETFRSGSDSPEVQMAEWSSGTSGRWWTTTGRHSQHALPTMS